MAPYHQPKLTSGEFDKEKKNQTNPKQQKKIHKSLTFLENNAINLSQDLSSSNIESKVHAVVVSLLTLRVSGL